MARKKGSKNKTKPDNIVNQDKPLKMNNTTNLNVPVNTDNYNMLKIVAYINNSSIRNIINELINGYIQDNMNIIKSVERLKMKHNSPKPDKPYTQPITTNPDIPTTHDSEDNPNN